MTATRHYRQCGDADMRDNNIWTNTWEPGEDWSGGGGESKRLPRGSRLGATVYELGPRDFAVYHFHHGSEGC